MLKCFAFVLALAACGGGAKSSQTMVADKPAPSECETVANHVADVVMTFKDPPPTTKDVVAEVVKSHCESDGWSAEAKKCLGEIADEDTAKKCVSTLTEAQHDSVMKDLQARTGHVHDHENGTPENQSPPPPGGGGPMPDTGADPCEGGE